MQNVARDTNRRYAWRDPQRGLLPPNYPGFSASIQVVRYKIHRQRPVFGRHRVAYLADGALPIYEIDDLVSIKLGLVTHVQQLGSFAIDQLDFRVTIFAQAGEQNIVVLISQWTEFVYAHGHAFRIGGAGPGRGGRRLFTSP